MNITYRKMNRGEYQVVKKLIRQAWFDEYVFKDKVKDDYAKAYLRTYLADSNYRMVACDDDKVVGQAIPAGSMVRKNCPVSITLEKKEAPPSDEPSNEESNPVSEENGR